MEPLVEVFSALEAACFERPWSAADIDSHLTHPDSIALLYDSAGVVLFQRWPLVPPRPVAADLDQAVAYLLARWLRGEESLELLRIGVLPAWRGRGLGRRALQSLIGGLPDALDPIPAQVILEVQEENQAARRLYASVGFAEVRRRRGYYGPNSDGLDLFLRRRP